VPSQSAQSKIKLCVLVLYLHDLEAFNMPVKPNTHKKETSTSFSLWTEYDVYLFKAGKHHRLYEKMGCHPIDHHGEKGCYFSVWAPNAVSVCLISDFNSWDKTSHPLHACRDESGVWELFMPSFPQGTPYKYFIVNRSSGIGQEKFDPFARLAEMPPRTASVSHLFSPEWKDSAWMKTRGDKGLSKAFSIYEVHLGSWRRVPEEDNRPLSYRELAAALVPYVSDLGFTHVEFLPITEHPFYGSWGYQSTGFFSPTSRYGTPEDFAFLIDAFHAAGIGVILDWVPSHFPCDAFALGDFDGTHLYEHDDPRKGFHPDWRSYIFNYGRLEVRSFLLSSAIFWIDQFHLDGLRVDAVASMLYLDYSRNAGEWVPNEHGGNENLDAISFLKELNEIVYLNFPDVHTIAEESTAWPGVSRPTSSGGLGFGMKWMMGWMHDTLGYFQRDPIYRKHHQNQITFSIHYAFHENFCLPLSHDEVVHGKKSLLSKMPGDVWQQCANLRLLYAYMFTHPGTKLLFMGAELGQWTEWNHDQCLDWHLLKEERHQGIYNTIKKLNKIYKTKKALHEWNFKQEGFEFIDIQDAEQSIISYMRKSSDGQTLVVVCNFTPVPRPAYRIGVPISGTYRLLMNTDWKELGGSGSEQGSEAASERVACHGRNQSISLELPPLGCLILEINPMG
jgi:1,4-alpha-glucan branching enzyme